MSSESTKEPQSASKRQKKSLGSFFKKPAAEKMMKAIPLSSGRYVR